MCNDKVVIENSIFFEENEIIGSEDLVDGYDSKRQMVLSNYHFKQDLAILTTKKVFTFKYCIIEGNLHLPDNVSKICFENCTILHASNNIRIKGGEIKELIIRDTTIKEKLYLNDKGKSKTTIDKLEIDNVVFKEKFKLINCDIKDFMICNSDFQKDVHITDGCKLSRPLLQSKVLFSGINFHDNNYFTKTEFERETEFRKVTFSANVDFQETIFHAGLNLNKTTIKKGINFAGCKGLDSKQSIEKTPKETYRIIKNNFLKLQNRIEANKFYSLELEKQKRILYEDFFTREGFFKKKQERVVYFMHMISSNFGKSWGRALVGIFFIGLITSCLINCNLFYYFFDCPKDILEYFFSEGIKYSYLLNRSKEFFNLHPLIYLFNKIVLGYWYYQFVMAARKDTKR